MPVAQVSLEERFTIRFLFFSSTTVERLEALHQASSALPCWLGVSSRLGQREKGGQRSPLFRPSVTILGDKRHMLAHSHNSTPDGVQSIGVIYPPSCAHAESQENNRQTCSPCLDKPLLVCDGVPKNCL